MQRQITFRSMTSTQALENYTNEYMTRIYSFLENEREPIYTHMILTGGVPHAHSEVELLIKTPHYDLVIKKEGPDMYKLINEVIDLAYLQLHEKKKKLIEDERTKDSYKSA
jgi:ribosome-associated translation inhibitor RaiA